MQTREGHGGLGLHAANFEDSGVGCLLRRVLQECAFTDPGRTGQHHPDRPRRAPSSKSSMSTRSALRPYSMGQP
jgi:hypothetical protein